MCGGVGENASSEHRWWNWSEVMSRKIGDVDVHFKVEDQKIVLANRGRGCSRSVKCIVQCSAPPLYERSVM
jgi:hypothetical protein